MNAGLRRYGNYPTRPYRRNYWELQCIIRGRAVPTHLPGSQTLKVPRLYLFPPDHLHGWIAPKGDLSEMLVIHIRRDFEAAQPGGRGGLQNEIFDLKELDLLRLRTLYDWLHPHFVAPRESGTEVLEAGCVLLASWLADLRHIDDIEPVDGTSDAANRVAQARYFYLREIIHNPSVEKISNLMGLSASQLRRSFAAAGEPPPLQVFRSIQLDYARRLLIGSSDPVSRVAEELGFGSLSSFTRAFTRHFGHSPLGVRRTGFNQR